MLVASQYQIVRGARADSKKVYAFDREPLRVAILIDEPLFSAMGDALVEGRTVYLQDRLHDWDWSDNAFRYYGRQGEKMNLLLVFSEEEDGRTPFCGECGAAAEDGCEHQ